MKYITEKDLAWIVIFYIITLASQNLTNHITSERISNLSERVTIASESRELLWETFELDLNITQRIVKDLYNIDVTNDKKGP